MCVRDVALPEEHVSGLEDHAPATHPNMTHALQYEAIKARRYKRCIVPREGLCEAQVSTRPAGRGRACGE